MLGWQVNERCDSVSEERIARVVVISRPSCQSVYTYINHHYPPLYNSSTNIRNASSIDWSCKFHLRGLLDEGEPFRKVTSAQHLPERAD